MEAIVNIYKRDGEWAFARFDEDGFDCSDTIGCGAHATEDEARADVAAMFPGEKIERVGDIGAAE